MSSPAPDSGENLGPSLNTVTWVFTALALASVVLRLYTRQFISHAFGWDDVVIAWSMVINIVSSALYTACVAAGLGKHVAYVPKDKIIYALKLNTITASIVVHSFSWAKLAIVLLLNRLLLPNRIMKSVLFFLVSTLICSSFVLTILWLRQCTPLAKNWDKTVPGSCLPSDVITDFSYFTAAYSAFQDLLFSIYPVFVISRLQMPVQRKAALSIILSLGLIACAVTIYKATVVRSLTQTQDPTYYTTSLYIWTSIESGLLIIIASLPTLSPLISLITGKVASTVGGSYRSRGRSTDKQSGSGSMGIFAKGSDSSRSKPRRSKSVGADDIKLLDMITENPRAAPPSGRVSEDRGQMRAGNAGNVTSQTNTTGAPARARAISPGLHDSDEDLGVAVTKTVDVSIEPDEGGRSSRAQGTYGTTTPSLQTNDQHLVNDLESGWR